MFTNGCSLLQHQKPNFQNTLKEQTIFINSSTKQCCKDFRSKMLISSIAVDNCDINNFSHDSFTTVKMGDSSAQSKGSQY